MQEWMLQKGTYTVEIGKNVEEVLADDSRRRCGAGIVGIASRDVAAVPVDVSARTAST